MSSVRTVGLAAFAVVALLVGIASAQPCAPGWDAAFAEKGADRKVWAFLEFDDGSGPALYAGGDFTTIGGELASGLAKWDGHRWTEVGDGVSFDGSPGQVRSLATWDDGSGPAIYVGGWFDHAGGVAANHVAKWDGREWSALGGGTGGYVQSFGVYDDGRGEALYAGGFFRSAGGIAAEHIARWDGQRWEALGEGLTFDAVGVLTMAVFEDSQGRGLFVGGGFTYAGAVAAHYFARWDGREWLSPDGDTLRRRSEGQIGHVDQLVVWDDGNGPALYVAGEFQDQEGNVSLLRWDGASFTALPGIEISPASHIAELVTRVEDSREVLYAGSNGTIVLLNPRRATCVARFDGRAWLAPLSFPVPNVFALQFFNDGFGEALYVGGDLRLMQPESTFIHNITRWSAPHMALQHTALRAGQPARFSTTCATPGGRVYFTYSTTGLGSFFVPQLNVTLDLDAPHLAGSGVANQDGRAELIRRIPPDASGRTVYLQAAEQGRKSEVVEAMIK
ncbi:MAG: hypothetical protein IT430_16445 [Phycisphaerales bacterium]|nr:hypothetical protein [Phycisphaerales bacterium]